MCYGYLKWSKLEWIIEFIICKTKLNDEENEKKNVYDKLVWFVDDKRFF